MTFKVGDRVCVKREIQRVPQSGGRSFEVYAQEGETGTVVDIFRSFPGGNPPEVINAKVAIDGAIKTFRLSSLRKLNDDL